MFILDPNLEQYATPLQWEKLKALEEHGSHRKAAESLGLTKSSITRTVAAVISNAAQHGYAPDHDMTHPTAPGFRIRGTSTLYDAQTGQAKVQWIKTQADEDQRLEAIKQAVDAWCEEVQSIAPTNAPTITQNDKLMSVIPFGDPHFGMYAWKDETGDDDFDTDMAKRDLCAAVSHLVNQSPPSKRCVIMNLGDFFHADNTKGETAQSGNKLDMDTRLPRVMGIGVAAMRTAIETALTKHETVEIINAIGNHDEVLSMAMSIMLANVYEDEPRVVIHAQPTRRHYIQHGKVMIGVTHGDRTKDSDLPGIMAAERGEMWGQTKHRYFYRGHHHHTQRNEFHGTIVEQFRTLAPSDAWHSAGGYISGRDMHLIVHHADFGEVARSICSIDMLRSGNG